MSNRIYRSIPIGAILHYTLLKLTKNTIMSDLIFKDYEKIIYSFVLLTVICSSSTR